MPHKPTKPVTRPVLSKTAGRRALGVDAPRTKPLQRINDKKTAKGRKK